MLLKRSPGSEVKPKATGAAGGPRTVHATGKGVRRDVGLALAATLISWVGFVSYTPLPLALMLAALLCGFVCLLVLLRLRGAHGPLEWGAVVLVAFGLIYPVSAFAHLIVAEGERFGPFDLVMSARSPRVGLIYAALGLISVALGGLVLGMGRIQEPDAGHARRLRVRRWLLVTLGLLFCVLGTWGFLALFGSPVGFLEKMVSVDRSSPIPVGLARYYNLSRWLSWGVTFLYAAALDSEYLRRPWLALAALWGVTALCLASVFWQGGRGDTILVTVPLLVLATRLRPAVGKKFLWQLVPALVVAFGVITVERLGVAPSFSPGLWQDMREVLDWHVGRFSVVGLTVDMTKSDGFALGSTIAFGVVETLNAPSTLLKVQNLVRPVRPMTSVLGEHLTGDPAVNAFLPSAIGELYYNFGVLGVFLGFLGAGLVLRWCFRIMAQARSVGRLLVTCYATLQLCISFLAGSVTLWIYFVVTLGLPVLLLGACEAAIPWLGFALHRQGGLPNGAVRAECRRMGAQGANDAGQSDR